MLGWCCCWCCCFCCCCFLRTAKSNKMGFPCFCGTHEQIDPAIDPRIDPSTDLTHLHIFETPYRAEHLVRAMTIVSPNAIPASTITTACTAAEIIATRCRGCRLSIMFADIQRPLKCQSVGQFGPSNTVQTYAKTTWNNTQDLADNLAENPAGNLATILR